MFLSQVLSGLILASAVMVADNAHAEKYLYTAPESGASEPQTLNNIIVSRLKNERVSRFAAALKDTQIPENYDSARGYTVFAVVDEKFDGKEGSVGNYILNDRIGVKQMHGTLERHETLTGETLRLNRIGNTYFANDMLINDEIHYPEGVVYIVGGYKDMKGPIVR